MNVKYKLMVDFAWPNKSNIVMISENDTNSRVCHFTLLFNKEPFKMDDVAFAVVKGVRPDGMVVEDTAEIILDENGYKTNQLEYIIPLSMSETTGKSTMVITLSSDKGETITSFEFYISSRNALYQEDEVSEEDKSNFAQLLNKINQQINKFNELMKNETLPNPEQLTITVDGVTYNYSGASEVVINKGNIAYIDETNPAEPEESIDETAAHQAIEAAKVCEEGIETNRQMLEDLNKRADQIDQGIADAESFANNAKENADKAFGYYTEINRIVPTIVVSPKVDGKYSITITTVDGVQIAELMDGHDGNKWYRHDLDTIISGTGVITNVDASVLGGDVRVGDNYINTSRLYVYHCSRVISQTNTEWTFDFEFVAGGGGGVSRLSLLDDVSVGTVTDGQGLVFDASLNKWVARDLASDVAIDDETIKKNGAGELKVADEITDKLSSIHKEWRGTKAQWESDTGNIPKSTLVDGDDVIITDDYDSKICNTITECDESTSLNDIAGAKAIVGVKAYVDSEVAKASKYSTEETVIGTYDGKVHYRKIVKMKSSGSIDTPSDAIVTDLNIDTLTSLKGVLKASGNCYLFAPTYLYVTSSVPSSLTGICGWYAKVGSDYCIRVQHTITGFNGADVEVTIEYTKK